MTVARQPAIRLVEAGAPHAPVLAALHAACFDEPWPEAEMAKLMAMPGTRAIIATEGAGETPVAFAIIRAAADECEVISIGVVPAWRRHGIGRTLLGRCQDVAADVGARSMFLEVAEFNHAALAFYASLGYVPVGQRANYYRGRDGRRATALILACDLDEATGSRAGK